MSKCEFEYEVLSSRKINLVDPEKSIFSYKGLLTTVRKENPSLTIASGFSFATMKLWMRSWFCSTPYLIWSGHILAKGRHESFFRRLQRKLLIKRAVGFIAYGTKAREYLVSLGIEPEKIVIGINTVDTEYFKNETEKIRVYQRNNKRKYLLYIGYIVKRKRIDLLFHVIKILSKKRNDFILKLVGDGPEMRQLKILARELDIIDFISFEGFRHKKEIPRYLKQSDCFLFPTGFDIWGLVLVEVMAAGLPCISSINAGSTYDLIEDGINGFAMDFSKATDVAEKIDWILNNPEISDQIGRNASLFIAENVNLEKSARGFIQAINNALNN
jgi:glycosyltransferase involved in cell wall biosynthesis